MMSDDGAVIYQTPAPGVVRIVQNRPEKRNAQDLSLTYELNAAFDRAAQDDAVKVIILAGSGPHFSAGHDLTVSYEGAHVDRAIKEEFGMVGTWAGFDGGGAHTHYARERETYLDMTMRWRELPKPTIAEVQGKCIAGGLMLAWACDIIVASDDAMFRDPVVTMGVCGAELFLHPWELGPRKAKELLFTADWWTAEEAYRLGMVNHVVPRSELSEFTLSTARKIAEKPLFALKLTKEAVNKTMDAMGLKTGLDIVFGLHQLCHAHNEKVFGIPVDPAGISGAVKKS
jgi:enoyl-CoA hydratase